MAVPQASVSKVNKIEKLGVAKTEVVVMKCFNLSKACCAAEFHVN